MKRHVFLALLAAASTSHALVIRDDVDDSAYRVSAFTFPAPVDFHGEESAKLPAPSAQ